MPRQSGLGKGLDALIPGVDSQPTEDGVTLPSDRLDLPQPTATPDYDESGRFAGIGRLDP